MSDSIVPILFIGALGWLLLSSKSTAAGASFGAVSDPLTAVLTPPAPGASPAAVSGPVAAIGNQTPIGTSGEASVADAAPLLTTGNSGAVFLLPQSTPSLDNSNILSQFTSPSLSSLGLTTSFLPDKAANDPTATKDYIQQQANAVAAQKGLDPALFSALITQESGWQPTVTSPVGAYGLTQTMPDTAAALGYPIATQQGSILAQLNAGADYLSQQLTNFGGSYTDATAAYNAGPGAVQQYGGVPPYAETQNYVQSIQSIYAQNGGTNWVSAPTADSAGLDEFTP